MVRKMIVLAVGFLMVLGLAVPAFAVPANYTFEITLVDNSLVDTDSAGLLGKPVWYQWLYKVEVVPGGSTHQGLSHMDVTLLDCYDETLLGAIEPTIGFNSGNLYGLSGDKVRTYEIVLGVDGATGVYGLKWNALSSEQLDTIGEYDYFWFSAPTNLAQDGTGVIKYGSNALFLDVETPQCPGCDKPVVPEPTTALLLGSGLVGAVLRRKKS